eukprot:TRINITY_DN6941_c0_g1_i1.p1 TRINITY_DN6941_c0_g1~~TRINITY_DN6941_c0_g1_i1.p1  ORF type:complete len:165 (-),score=23.31 TRINITY_DN6941_c0_g1_i1:68-562(-)
MEREAVDSNDRDYTYKCMIGLDNDDKSEFMFNKIFPLLQKTKPEVIIAHVIDSTRQGGSQGCVVQITDDSIEDAKNQMFLHLSKFVRQCTAEGISCTPLVLLCASPSYSGIGDALIEATTKNSIDLLILGKNREKTNGISSYLSGDIPSHCLQQGHCSTMFITK